MKDPFGIRFPTLLARTFSTAIAAALTASLPAHADNLFVANGGDNTIEEFSTSGGAGTVFASGSLLNSPNGLAFDSSGNLFVDNYTGNNIIEYTPNGVGSVFASTGLRAPNGMVFDGSGNLYVANSYSYTEVYAPNGVGTVFATDGQTYPTGVALNNSGNLFVAESHYNLINEYTPGGMRSIFTTVGLSSPQGIAFDASGNLYVANKGDGNPGSGYIEKYTPGGTGSVFASGLYFPDGMAFDSAGDLFVTSRGSSNNLIYEFSPQGAESIFATNDLSTPCFIAIEASPEPSTWTIVALGGMALVVSGWVKSRTAVRRE